MTGRARSAVATRTAGLVLTLAALATCAAIFPVPDPVRAAATLSFALVAPGAAIAGLLGIRTAAAWATVTVAGSLTVGVITTELAALAGWWQPRALLVGMAAVCALAGLLVRRLDRNRVPVGGLT